MLDEQAAPPLSITVQGVTYRLTILRAKDWAEAAAYLNTRRTKPLAIVARHLKDLPESAQNHLLDLAYRDERNGDFLPIEDVMRWFGTPEGRVYKMWLCLRTNHGEQNIESVESLLNTWQVELETESRLDGKPLGNSTAPAPSNGQSRGEPQSSPSPAGLGVASSASLAGSAV